MSVEINDSGTSTENIFPETLQKSIEKIMDEEGYETSDIYKKQISTGGANYMGYLFEVTIKGKTADGEKETNIFVKKRPLGDNMSAFISVSVAYSREAFFYNELSILYKEFEEANVPLGERYRTVKGYNVSNTEAIIMENIALQGFNLPYRMDVISLRYAELAVKQLAKFHSLSFVLERKRPEYYKKTIESLFVPVNFKKDSWKDFMLNFINIAINNMEDAESKQKVEKYIPTFVKKLPIFMGSDPSVTCCISYGDYRHSNILKRDIDGEVAEVIPIDYQSLYYGCPVTDFLFFIYIGTDWQFRKKHMTDLKDLYHKTLSGFLEYFDIDVDDVYPKEKFENDFQKRLEYGLMIALFCYPILFVVESEVPDFDKDDVTNVNFNLDARFQERMKGLLEEFTEYGYI